MASDNGFFATKSISLNICGGRKPQTLMDAARHNLREIQAERGAGSHINASRIAENVLLAGPGTAEGVQTVAGEWLDGAGIDPSKLRRDHCQAIEVLFSLPEQSGIEPVTYFRRCLEWVIAEMRLPVISAVIHMDEKTPHCHALLLPVREGKHVGSYPIAREKLRGLRDSFFNTVAGPAGLKRMGAKMVGGVKRMAVAAVLRACEAQGLPEKNGALWPFFRAAIERDPTKAVQALNLSEKEIRAGEKGAPNPIGFAGDNTDACPNPIGFEKHPQKTKPYLCVGFAKQTTSPAPAERAASGAEASGSEVKEEGVDAGRKAAPVAKVAPAAPAPAPAPATATATATPAEASAGPSPVVAVVEKDEGDGVVRVRDEFADDLSAWGDY